VRRSGPRIFPTSHKIRSWSRWCKRAETVDIDAG
jgi:hypothetical protein